MKCKTILQDGVQCKNKCLFDGHCWRHSKQTCAICHEATSAKRNLTSHRLTCGHAFHRKCISKWFIHSDICPTCRKVQSQDSLVKFKIHVENKVHSQYQQTIAALESEVDRLRIQQYQMYQHLVYQHTPPPPPITPDQLPRG